MFYIIRLLTRSFLLFVFSFCCIENVYSASDDNGDWSRESMMKEKMNNKGNYFYAGFGFTMSGIGFRMSDGSVISNGFMSDGILLGDSARLGYEYIGSKLYFGAEMAISSVFSVASNGLVGVLSSGESISLESLGRGTISAMVNIKPGFAFGRKKGALYFIAGAAYQWLYGSYVDKLSTTHHFDMSGFGLNYGLGMKYEIQNFVVLFVEFNSIAPIPGNGKKGLDRTAIDTSTGAAVHDIVASELYSLTIGVDFRA